LHSCTPEAPMVAHERALGTAATEAAAGAATAVH